MELTPEEIAENDALVESLLKKDKKELPTFESKMLDLPSTTLL